jgi:hypothetical protein
LTEWCGGSCGAGAFEFAIFVSGFKNPNTTIPPTNSFKINIDKIEGGNTYKTDAIETNFWALPTLRTGELNIASITRNQNQIGTDVQLTIKYQMNSQLTSGYLFVDFPSDSFYKGNNAIQCTFKGTVTACNEVFQTVTLGEQL